MRYILFFVLFLHSEQLVLGQSQNDLTDFLRSHKAPISDSQVQNFNFDKEFYNHQYFLFGENHGSAKPQETDFALITHLHRRAGVKYYIAEVDFTKAGLLNNYLASGDSTLLNKVFASWKRDTAQWANKEHYDKWIRLREYQTTLSPEKRLTVIGIDVPQDNALLYDHIMALTKQLKVTALQHYIDSLNHFATLADRKELVSYCKRFLPVLKDNQQAFTKALNRQFPGFKHLITSLTHLGAGHTRDKVMFLNLMSQLSEQKLQEEKMYGFLGFYHCLQTSYNKAMPFAALLRESITQQASVVSLVMLALDSKTMLPFVGPLKQMMPIAQVEKLVREHPGFPSSGRYIPYILSNDNPMMQVEGIDILKELSEPNAVSLFKLEGKNSPFRSTKLLGEVGGFQSIKMTDPNDHTLNAFQFIVLFRNSKEATPLE